MSDCSPHLLTQSLPRQCTRPGMSPEESKSQGGAGHPAHHSRGGTSMMGE
jgi:hypothetical protein